MEDRTLIIILAGLNIVMWMFVFRYMNRLASTFTEMGKKQANLIDEQGKYLHNIHENIMQMTRMNLEAMGIFTKKQSDTLSAMIAKIQGNEQQDIKENGA